MACLSLLCRLPVLVWKVREYVFEKLNHSDVNETKEAKNEDTGEYMKGLQYLIAFLIYCTVSGSRPCREVSTFLLLGSFYSRAATSVMLLCLLWCLPGVLFVLGYYLMK